MEADKMVIYKLIGVTQLFFIISFCLLMIGCACDPGTPPKDSLTVNNSPYTSINVNEKKIIPVSAIKPWNWTIKDDVNGIILDKEHTYQFEVEKLEDWIDDDIISDPEEGWKTWKRIPFSLLFWLRRCPSEPWYALVGAVYDKSGNWHCFKIGNGLNKFRPESLGKLFVFANDMNGFYCNNSGTLELSIRRLE